MRKNLYDLMDWAAIEEITYVEAPHPKSVLGAHTHGNNTLIQIFIPGAEQVNIRIDGSKSIKSCELADEEGFFACLVKKKLPFKYTVEAVTPEGELSFRDPYSFRDITTKRRIQKFLSGTDNKAYELFGAHPQEVEGVEGVRFTVYAPGAMRVCVVGDFNSWNGAGHQMEDLYDTGVFELFVPGVGPDELYKFEIRSVDGRVRIKTDPFGSAFELRPDNAALVVREDGFEWTDEKHLKSIKTKKRNELPFSIYEAQCAAFKDGSDEKGYKYKNYRKIASELYSHMNRMGYQALELLPVAEYPQDESLGFNAEGFFAPTSRFGSPSDLKYLVNFMHEKGIEVIVELPIASFTRDEEWLYLYDGGAVFESTDPLRAERADGNINFDLSKPEVRSFLMSAVFFWASQFHLDGIKLYGLSSMLYHDFGKQDGSWVPNIFGGSENLEAAQFIRELTEGFKRKFPGRLIMAADTSSWGELTTDTDDSDHALGFDYCWNLVFSDKLTDYMSLDPLYRTHHYDELVFPPVIAGSENFITGFSHWDVSGGRGALINRMSGNDDEKEANLKALFALQYTYGGRKLVFMGQDMADGREFDADYTYPAASGEREKMMEAYFKDLLSFYNSHPALYEDDTADGAFEWINCISAKENIIVFVRRSADKKESLLVVFNFENIPRKNYRIGVPFAGKYKEVFNSDAEKYGGFDFRNPKLKASEPVEWDGRKNSIAVKVPPLAVSIFECEEA